MEGYTTRTDMTEWTAHRGRTAASTGCLPLSRLPARGNLARLAGRIDVRTHTGIPIFCLKVSFHQFRILVDWFHLVLISVWVGEVLVAGLFTLAAPPGARDDDWIDCERYIAALSTMATFSLGGIVATGLVNAWYTVGNPGAVIGNEYGTALLFKLALVAIAVLLGGYNRFFVMPSLTASLSTSALARFTLILRVEAAVLSAVLIVAAILSSTPTPTAA